MKTLLTSLLAVLFLLPSSGAKANNIITKSDDGKIKIVITIDIGRKSKGCTGFGVCSIKVEADLLKGPAGDNTASGTAWVENGRLMVAFNRPLMTDATYDSDFSSGQFRVEENYTLTPDVAKALGLGEYTVRAGSYPAPPNGDPNGTIVVGF